MTGQLVLIYTAPTPAQAEVVKGLLTAAGIPAAIFRESAGAVYGLTVGPLGMAQVMVAEEHAATAREIIATMDETKED